MKKILTRILISSVVVIAVIVALIGGSIAYEGTQGVSRLDAIINTRIKNLNGPEIRAYVARPKQVGQYPAVIMIHEFWGLNAEIIGKAEALAQEGYVVVAPDVFRGSTSGQVPRAIYQVVSNAPAQVNTDLDAVFAWLTSQPDVKTNKIAIMGFCFGGGTSLNYSLSNNKLAGTVMLYGERSLLGMRPHKIVGLGLARTFQGIRLFGGMSVADNALVGLIVHQGRVLSRHGLLSWTTASDRRMAWHWLEFVGLADRAHLLASELSYGDRRRLEIARALVSRPSLLLLDEPAAGTNPTEKRELMTLVRQVRDSGVAVVLIEHDMGLVMGLSDRVIVLDMGRVIAEGPPALVQDDQRVIDAYLGREDDESVETVEEVLGWHS